MPCSYYVSALWVNSICSGTHQQRVCEHGHPPGLVPAHKKGRRVEGVLQSLCERYGYIHFARVPEGKLRTCQLETRRATRFFVFIPGGEDRGVLVVAGDGHSFRERIRVMMMLSVPLRNT